MSPREYRAIVTGIQGGRPPCIQCNDSDVSFCMKTGFECQKFVKYSAVPMTDVPSQASLRLEEPARPVRY